MRLGLASSLPAAPNPAGRSRIHPGQPEMPVLGIAPEGDIGAGSIKPDCPEHEAELPVPDPARAPAASRCHHLCPHVEGTKRRRFCKYLPVR